MVPTDATEELDERELRRLEEIIGDAPQYDEATRVVIYGHTVALRDIGDACHCCPHDCEEGGVLYEAEVVGRLHGRQCRTEDDELADALAAMRVLLAPHRVDTEAGREQYQLAENVRLGVQPALLEGAS